MKPSRAQVRVTAAVVEWYIRTHYGTPGDPGLPAMFFDRGRVGPFATTHDEFAAGNPVALHRVLIAMIMFQRLRDVQITRILQRMEPAVARELTSPRRILSMVEASPCPSIKSRARLHEECDLSKRDGIGTCNSHSTIDCHLKRHTVALRRYGHFGKFPTSAALVLAELRVRSLRELRDRALGEVSDPSARADVLQRALSLIWRVSDKIGAMFLSAVTNPDLGPAPWREGIDWTKFVVIDSNVDLFVVAPNVLPLFGPTNPQVPAHCGAA